MGRRDEPLESGTSRARIREELAFHIEERAREFEAQGMSPDDALAAARAAFGDQESIERRTAAESGRRRGDSRGGGSMDGWIRDFRTAFRGLRRNPGFASIALLTLALGIGANTAIFSVVQGVFLRSPSVEDPASLVNVYTTCRAGAPRCSSSYPDYLDYASVSSLSGLAATAWTSVNASEEGRPPALLTARLVSGNYFSVLGLNPAQGRLLQPGDDQVGAPATVAVLTHETWRNLFGSDPGIVGRTVRLNGTPFQVVGVTPESYTGTNLGQRADLYLPLTHGGEVTRFESRGARWMDQLIGRLAPGATIGQLTAELEALSESLRTLDPDARGTRSITIDSARRFSLPQFGREELSRFIAVLAAVVGFTLLLACANVANLLLARGAGRAREVGIRKAIGASRGLVLRQWVIESMVLSVLGGLLGLTVARGVIGILGTTTLPGGIRLSELGVGIDGGVLAFTFGLSLLTGLVFGVAPAIRSSGMGINAVLKGVGDSSSRSGNRLRKALVAVQVGLCVVLLAGSALFVQTLRNGLALDLGFEPDGLAAVRFNLASLGMEEASAQEALDRMVQGIERLPGVSSASYASRVPLQQGGAMGIFAQVEGYEPAPDEEMRMEYVAAGPNLLETLGNPLLQGRSLGAGEDAPTLWINRTTVERYFQGRSPIGRTITIQGTDLVVAGVTDDIDWDNVGEVTISNAFIPYTIAERASDSPVTLVVRSDRDAGGLIPEIQREVRAVVPDVTFMFAQTSNDMLGESLGTQRMGAWLLSAFGIVALLLATVGIGGVVGYLMHQRRREFGLRIALGASAARVLRSVVTEMAVPVLLGTAVGAAIALSLGGQIEVFLLDVSARDSGTLVSVAGFLLAVALCAVIVPARGAATIQPMETLRDD